MTSCMPLVLLPGLLCDYAMWQYQVKFFEGQADCRVAETSLQDSIPAIVHAILETAPPQFALAGLSMGGYVAFELMRQAPERVLKLCLLNTSARPDTPEQSERRRMLLAMSKSGQFKGVTPRLLPMLISESRLQDAELTHIITSMAERMGREAFRNQQTAILHRIDSVPSLKNIRCPVQVIAGINDTLTPPDVMREIADGIPNARFDVIPDCGHLSPLERPDAVNPLMKRWLFG